MIPGIDVSNWQGTIDWDQVAAQGITFAIAKASEGITFWDPTFARNMAGMLIAGISRGAYHYALPSQHQPEHEAAWFLDAVGSIWRPGDIVVLDMEDPAAQGDLSDWVVRWNAKVRSELGIQPLLYSNVSYIQEHNLGVPAVAESGLWLASWSAQAPVAPAPWTFWAIWQWSANGNVSGLGGPVDMDEFNGTIDQFHLYGTPAAVSTGG